MAVWVSVVKKVINSMTTTVTTLPPPPLPNGSIQTRYDILDKVCWVTARSAPVQDVTKKKAWAAIAVESRAIKKV
jgi:hypothetical protein